MARRASRKTTRPLASKLFTVLVTRISAYNVKASTADKAIDVYLSTQPKEIDETTLDMTATRRHK